MKTEVPSQDKLFVCRLKIPAFKISRQTIEGMMPAELGHVRVCGWCMSKIKHRVNILLGGEGLSNSPITVKVTYQKV